MFNRAKYIVLAFALVAVFVAGCSSQAATSTEQPAAATNTPTMPTPTSPPEQPSDLTDRVDVVYFHRGDQCHCMAVVEENIHTTVLENFQDELQLGKLTFTSLASDDKANYEMAMKYKTGPFGLFLTIVKGNTEKIVPVEEIWSMTGNEEKYRVYVNDIIAKSLRGEL